MKNLITKLNELFEKYKVEEADKVEVQKLLAEVEGTDDDEFNYEEKKDEE